jgi:hypothetical protein
MVAVGGSDLARTDFFIDSDPRIRAMNKRVHSASLLRRINVMKIKNKWIRHAAVDAGMIR